ncbi:MAG: hypothetical protein ACRKGH_09570 [Dehalogenimonas sp.]
MDIGDRVKMIRGNPFGKEGIITFSLPIKTSDVNGDISQGEESVHFEVKADDGTVFQAAEDQLQLVNTPDVP